MALSADTPRVYELGDINKLPVLASATIYEGSAVGLSSGYARALVAGDAFMGFARRGVVEETAANGGADVEVVTKGLLQATITSVAVTDVGSSVYMSADGTFTLTKGSNSWIGLVYRYVASNTCIVAFIASGQAQGQVAAGGTLASGEILVGNVSNVSAGVVMSGDITITNAGVTAIGNGKVTKTMLLSGTLSELLSYAKSYVSSHVSSSAH
jgi:hypothetical protein